MAALYSGTYLSTDSNKVDEVEEAEAFNVPPAEKLLVLGGNGFIGSHICKLAVDRGLSVASVSRSGRSSIQDSWASNVIWHQGLFSCVTCSIQDIGLEHYYVGSQVSTFFQSAGDLLSPGSWEDALNGVTSVISCVGALGPNSYTYEINGTANINAIRAASEKGVKRFVYISSASAIVENKTHLFSPLFRGYYAGKRAAQAELRNKFPNGGVVLGPGFIYGTRRVGSMNLPLGVIGFPLEKILNCVRPLRRLPLVGPLFNPRVNVTSVAKAALRGATDPLFPPGAVDLDEIQRYGKEKF